MNNKFGGDEGKFAAVYQLGGRIGEFAIHGGGVPIRVQGVEGVVAVCVVSGLKQWDDHQAVIEGIRKLKEGMGMANGTAMGTKAKGNKRKKVPLRLKKGGGDEKVDGAEKVDEKVDGKAEEKVEEAQQE